MEGNSPFFDDFMEHEPVSFEWNMEGKAQAQLNDGINLLEEKNYNAAIGSLSDAIQLDARLWMSYYYRGVCNKRLGNLKDAEKDFQKAMKIKEDAYAVFLELGKLEVLQQKSESAKNYFEKFVKAQPDDVRGYYQLGNIYFVSGDFVKARRYYQKCNDIKVDFPDSHVKIGLIEITQEKKLKSGISYFEKALSINPNHHQALLFHGLSSIEEDPRKSLSDFSTLIRLNPDNINFRFTRGYLLTEQTEYEKAFSDFYYAIREMQQNPNSFKGAQTYMDKRIDIQYAGYYTINNIYGLEDEPAFYVKKGFCLLLNGKYKNAIESFNEARVADESALTPFLTALSLEHMGFHAQAYPMYEKALKIDNKILDAHKKRGVYRTELKDWDGAIDDFTEMLRIDPMAFIAYKFRGVSHFYKDEFLKAKDDFTLYLTNDSTDKEAFSYRALCYEKLGDRLSAAYDFLEAGQENRIETLIPEEIITFLLKDGDTLNAEAKTNNFIRRFPQYPVAHAVKIKIAEVKEDWTLINKEIENSILVINPQTHEVVSYSYLLTVKAKILIHENKSSEALSVLNDAIRINVKNGEAYFQRAKLYLAKNKENNAKQDFVMAKNLGVKEADIFLNKK